MWEVRGFAAALAASAALPAFADRGAQTYAHDGQCMVRPGTIALPAGEGHQRVTVQ
jgi:hypothetical protein